MARNDSPAVSVLIAAYNVTPYIRETLDSVLAQTFQDFEIVLVNDGCPDTVNLEAAIEPYRGRIIYIKQPNGGPAAARNTAIQAARAPIVALLDADDMWLPDYLETQLGFLARDPSLDLIYPNMEIFGASPRAGEPLSSTGEAMGEVTFDDLLEQKRLVRNSAAMRRDAVLRAGMWYAPMRHSEDFDLWLRMAYAGSRMAYHAKVLARLRMRPGSLSMSYPAMYKGQLCAYARVRQNLALNPRQEEIVERMVRRTEALLAFHAGKEAFWEGDFETARRQFRDANAVLASAKTDLVLRCLNVAPRMLLGMARLRRRIAPRFQF